MLELNKVYNEDCLLTMSSMEDNYVDVSITSPPYNMGAGLRKKKIVKYDTYKDNKSANEYFDFLKNVLNELIRVTKNYVFLNIQEISGNKGVVREILNNFNVKETFIWVKPNSQCPINKRVVYSGFEYIFCLTKEEENRQFNYCNFNNHQGDAVKNFIIKNINSERNGHNFAFPLWLPKYFIKNFTMENDIIYDPFMGCGTTALACIELSRNYIGSEISENYCKIIQNRIELANSKIKLF